MHPILVTWSVGDAQLRLGSYGVLLTLAVFAALALFVRETSRIGVRREEALGAALLLVLAGVLGAKVLGLAVDRLLGATTSVTQSAGAIHGAVVAGLAFCVWVARRLRISYLTTLDCAAPAVALGQGIGRFGCFFAGCCWGIGYDGPLHVVFTSEVARDLTHVPLDVPLFPVQLLDGGVHLALSVLLARSFVPSGHDRVGPASGRRAALWLVLEGFVRFSIESLRGDATRGAWGDYASTGRVTAVALVAAGLTILVVRARSAKRAHDSMATR